jgi:hypothetical protein
MENGSAKYLSLLILADAKNFMDLAMFAFLTWNTILIHHAFPPLPYGVFREYRHRPVRITSSHVRQVFPNPA